VDLPKTCYLFSYFTNNGEDGLHLAWSRDGYKWEALNNGQSYLHPIHDGEPGIMRDPCLLLGPDNIFRLVWTNSWNRRSIGYASSLDLLAWTDSKTIPVMMHEPDARNSWAPEVHYDEAKREYLLIWSSTIPGRFPQTDGTSEDGYNHRIYSTTTADFQTFTPTKLFFDPGYSVIDATILAAKNQFYLIFKDEVRFPVAAKNLQLASSNEMEGPYAHVSPPFTESWVEGPTAIEIGDDYIVYFDCYTQERYGALRSKDLQHWDDVSAQLVMPKGARHGTVLAVPSAVIANLLAAPAR
jgi:hypothetical protein